MKSYKITVDIQGNKVNIFALGENEEDAKEKVLRNIKIESIIEKDMDDIFEYLNKIFSKSTK